METIDIVLRGGATALLLLISLMLIVRQPNRWIALFGSLLFFGIIGYLWSAILWPLVGRPLWAMPIYLGGHFVTVFFSLFALSVFEDDFKPNWLHGGVLLLVLVAWVLERLPLGWDLPSLFGGGTRYDNLFLTTHLIFAAIVIAAFIKVGSGISTDMVEGRRRARGWVIGVTGIYMMCSPSGPMSHK